MGSSGGSPNGEAVRSICFRAESSVGAQQKALFSPERQRRRSPLTKQRAQASLLCRMASGRVPGSLPWKAVIVEDCLTGRGEWCAPWRSPERADRRHGKACYRSRCVRRSGARLRNRGFALGLERCGPRRREGNDHFFG